MSLNTSRTVVTPWRRFGLHSSGSVTAVCLSFALTVFCRSQQAGLHAAEVHLQQINQLILYFRVIDRLFADWPRLWLLYLGWRRSRHRPLFSCALTATESLMSADFTSIKTRYADSPPQGKTPRRKQCEHINCRKQLCWKKAYEKTLFFCFFLGIYGS